MNLIMATDDIVTRLRGQACPECGLPSTHNQFDEAADEIERLRDSNKKLEHITERALELLDQANAILAKIQEAQNE